MRTVSVFVDTTFDPHKYADIPADISNTLKLNVGVAVHDPGEQLLGYFLPTTSTPWGFKWLEPDDYFTDLIQRTVDRVALLLENESTWRRFRWEGGAVDRS